MTINFFDKTKCILSKWPVAVLIVVLSPKIASSMRVRYYTNTKRKFYQAPLREFVVVSFPHAHVHDCAFTIVCCRFLSVAQSHATTL